jgi:hypothetical protein
MAACLKAVDDGVESASVIDGRLAHSLLLETLTTAGIGTQVDRRAPLPGARIMSGADVRRRAGRGASDSGTGTTGADWLGPLRSSLLGCLRHAAAGSGARQRVHR